MQRIYSAVGKAGLFELLRITIAAIASQRFRHRSNINLLQVFAL
jgi:hypothetical protein